MVRAHPGIGIVKDSKGFIYYTDLLHVWKIANGRKKIVVPNVHTHELHVDKADNLYGEGGYYDDKEKKFYHYLWRYGKNGRLDTVIGMREAYKQHNFSLARDKDGNEYYIKQFLINPDTNRIYQKPRGGKERIWASGNFKGVRWLHPQDDGSLLYVFNNALYRVKNKGEVQLVKNGLANDRPSFRLAGNNRMVWGTWQDKHGNIYVAVFSDGAVKKIDTKGNMITLYQSKRNWTPLHGVFDDQGRMYVLESSDKNEVRVTVAGPEGSKVIH
jgi:hypothetical protein